MAVQLPERPPIDRNRGGILSIAPCVLTDFLRLPVGSEVVAARVVDGTIELLIEGAGMPARMPECETERVTMVLHTETRPGAVDAGGCQARTTAHWAHEPELKWELRSWSTEK